MRGFRRETCEGFRREGVAAARGAGQPTQRDGGRAREGWSPVLTADTRSASLAAAYYSGTCATMYAVRCTAHPRTQVRTGAAG